MMHIWMCILSLSLQDYENKMSKWKNGNKGDHLHQTVDTFLQNSNKKKSVSVTHLAH